MTSDNGMRLAGRGEMARMSGAREELLAAFSVVMGKHNISDIECMCLLSHILGQVLAMQDQRAISSEQALEVVQRNIEAGNRDAIRGIMETVGSA
jgi:hypothetical protein